MKRTINVIVETTCRSLRDVDQLAEMIEDVIEETLDQDAGVEVKVTAEITQKVLLTEEHL